MTGTPILLHGGGIDSTAVFLMLATAEVDFTVIHADYGQPTVKGERWAVLRQCKEYDVPHDFVKLPKPNQGRDLFKARNALLLSLAFSRANKVYAGLTYDCVYKDSTQAFVDGYESMARTFNSKARLCLPLFHANKGHELMLIRVMDPAVRWWTCTVSRSLIPCRKCPHCVDERAFQRILRRMPEPRLPFQRDPKLAEQDGDL